MGSGKNHRNSVLIVEDDSISRAALTWLLKDLGFRPVMAEDLTSARLYLARHTPDIVILDLMLPDGDGTELLAEIRRDKKPIKVAVVTAVTDRLRLHEVTALSPDALFGKPIDLEDFDAWLVKLLSEFAMGSRDSLCKSTNARSHSDMLLPAR
jgi:DNA-binding response OmpR family regulator